MIKSMERTACRGCRRTRASLAVLTVEMTSEASASQSTGGTALPGATGWVLLIVTVAALVIAAVFLWRQQTRRPRLETAPLDVPGNTQGDATDRPRDLLLFCESPRRARQLVQWLASELPVRTATNADDAIDRMVDRRPDIVWLVIEEDWNGGLALARQLRAMQRDAYEAPSWTVVLATHASSRHVTEDGLCDQVMAPPRSRAACREAFRTTVARMPKFDRRPWIQRTTENAMPGFLASRRELARAISQALADGRHADAARSAHTLGGSPGLHAFEEGVAACRYIEQHHATASAAALLACAEQINDLLDQIELR